MAESNVRLRVDARDAVTALKQTNDASKKLNTTLGRTEKKAATATGNIQRMGVSFRTTVASVVALTGTATLLSRSLRVLGERQADTAALANGLEKLGKGEAELQKLQKAADELGKATLFDQEDFDRGFALLTSFQRVGVNSYKRVAKAAADVAQITGQDVKSALLQLSKALEDPARRVTDLSRSGTVFTEQQKEQIKALQESGRLIEAQNLVLSEIEKQYGGAAEAAGSAGYAGAVDSLGESFRDFQERLAQGVEPAVTTALKSLTDIFDVISKIPQPIGKAALGIGALTAAVYGLNAAILANPYLAAAAGLAAIAAAAVVGTQKAQRFAEVVKITGNTVNELETESKEVKDAMEALSPAIERGGRAAAAAKKKYKELADALGEIEQRRKVLEETFNIGGIQFEFTESGLTPINPPKTVSEEIEEQREEERKKKKQRDKEAAEQAKLLAKRREDAQAAALRDINVLRNRVTLNTALTDQEREMLQLQIDIADAESQRALVGDDITEDKIEMLKLDFQQRDVQRALLKDQERAAQLIQEAEDAKKKAQEEEQQRLEELNKKYKQIGDAIKNNITNSIMDAIEGTKSLGESALGVLKQLARQFLTLGINQAFSGLGSTGGILGKLFGGGMASGGTVQGGRSYMVGERGPELFTPNRTGSIAPSGSFGGANVTVNVDASGSSVEGNAEQASQLGKAIGVAVQQELIKQKRPGGLLAV